VRGPSATRLPLDVIGERPRRHDDRVYRRHPALFGYVRSPANGDPVVVLETSSVGPPLVVDDPRLVWALLVLPDAFTGCDARRRWSSERSVAEVGDELWRYLVSESLVVPEETAADGIEPFYHRATRSYPFLDMSQQDSPLIDNRQMQAYLRSDPYPPVFHDVGSGATHRLPSTAAALEAVSRPGRLASPETLSLLLSGSAGLRRHVRQRRHVGDRDLVQLELIFKSVPSGGSRHPTELYLLASGCAVPDGAYHYNVEHNRLDAFDTPPQALLGAVGERLPSPNGPYLVSFLVSHVRRAMWRYRDPRSFRAILFDAGHLEQQLYELARWLDIEYRSIRAFDQEAIRRSLGGERDAVCLAVGAVTEP
jgi:SagB-type dehydrogenase family enzyme